MTTYQTPAIVLSRTNLGESDRILRLLTPDHGRLSAVARGVRKIKSRAAGHLEPLGQVQLHLAHGKSLDVITSAQLQWYPYNLIENYDQLTTAMHYASLINRVSAENQPQPALYQHLSDTLHLLDSGSAGPLLELWFDLRLLAITGYQPELEHCAVCGQANPNTNYYFDATHGGIVDQACHLGTASAMSQDAIKLWRLIIAHSYQVITRVSGAGELANQTLPSARAFLEYHLG